MMLVVLRHKQVCLSVQVLIWLHQHSVLLGICFHAGHLEEDRC